MALVFNGKRYDDLQLLRSDAEFQSLPANQKAYLEALFQNQTPPSLGPVVPRAVTNRQFKTALVLRGISLDSIVQFIQSLPQPQKDLAWIAWEYSNDFERDNSLLNSLAPQLGFSQEELDDFFIFASTL